MHVLFFIDSDVLLRHHASSIEKGTLTIEELLNESSSGKENTPEDSQTTNRQSGRQHVPTIKAQELSTSQMERKLVLEKVEEAAAAAKAKKAKKKEEKIMLAKEITATQGLDLSNSADSSTSSEQVVTHAHSETPTTLNSDVSIAIMLGNNT